MTVIIAIIAMAVAIAALAISLKRQKVVKEKNTVIEHAPMDHPFYYDEKRNTYCLDGNLNVTGSMSCLKKEEEGSV